MVEFTTIFPEYPKTHEDGYATIVSLDPKFALQIAQDRKLAFKLIGSMQYSRSNESGTGFRRTENVEFFGNPETDDNVPMLYSNRQCAGVKVCEFFKIASHTEVDSDGLEWAQKLADQERIAKNESSMDKVLSFYHEFKNETCSRYMNNGTQCGGRAVIASYDPVDNKTTSGRLFLGCSRYQHRETNHLFSRLGSQDPIQVLRVWGRDRCRIHKDVLEALDFTWGTITGTI